MTWTRLDDNWQADPAFDRLDIHARWHYLMMIQFCSRGKRYDGVMPLAEAEMCSTAPDRTQIIGKLILAGLVTNIDGEMLRVVRIEDHVPPKSVRDSSAKRVSRHRKHKDGDHEDCLPKSCAEARNAVGNALPQDGEGQAVTGSTPEPEFSDDDLAEWEAVSYERRRAADDAA